MDNISAPSLLTRLKTAISRYRLFVFIALGIVVLSLILFAALYFLEPTSTPKNLFITNKTDHQVTISWTTDKATRGTILVSENKNFPLLPIFTKNSFNDDGEKGASKVGYYTTHFVTANKLLPNKIYQFKVYQGLREVYKGSFATGSTLTDLPSPNPIYGRVLRSDGKTPLPGAIVYFQAREASSSSALLSALTNIEGRWSIDLGNLRTETYRKAFLIGKKTQELLVIEAGDKGRVKSAAIAGLDKPWPDIVLREKGEGERGK